MVRLMTEHSAGEPSVGFNASDGVCLVILGFLLLSALLRFC